jgi:hypothetical protein
MNVCIPAYFCRFGLELLAASGFDLLACLRFSMRVLSAVSLLLITITITITINVNANIIVIIIIITIAIIITITITVTITPIKLAPCCWRLACFGSICGWCPVSPQPWPS